MLEYGRKMEEKAIRKKIEIESHIQKRREGEKWLERNEKKMGDLEERL